MAEVSPDDNAILYLTSGATGDPKMVMVTHGAVVANINAGPAVLPLTPDDITVAFLPSAHIAQRVVVELLPILSGSAVSFAENLGKLPKEIKNCAADVFSGAAAGLGTDLHHDPHRSKEEARRGAEAVLRRRWRWGWPRPAIRMPGRRCRGGSARR